MKAGILSLIVFLFFFNTHTSAQNKESRWAAGVHIASVMYSNIDGSKIGGSFIDQMPRVTLSRYMFNNITFQTAFSTSLLDSQKYTTFDGIVKYDFGTSDNNLSPYVLIGGSFISADKFTPTLNFGVGNTFWVFPNYGLNVQMMYKFSEKRFESQFSHLYPTIGIIYSFKSRNMSRRLWDINH